MAETGTDTFSAFSAYGQGDRLQRSWTSSLLASSTIYIVVGVLIVPLQRYFGYPLTLRFTTENILNAPYVFTQGPIVQEKYTNGVKFTIGLTLTP